MPDYLEPGLRIECGVDISGIIELWPGGKGLGIKKHRPGEPNSKGNSLTSAENRGPLATLLGRPYGGSIRSLDSNAVPARSRKQKVPNGF